MLWDGGRTSTQEKPLPKGRGSDGQLQLRQIPLVHIVVPDKLIRPGKLLLTVWPSAVEGFLTWEREKDTDIRMESKVKVENNKEYQHY